MVKDDRTVMDFSWFSNPILRVAFILRRYSMIVPRNNGKEAKEEGNMDHYEMVEKLRQKANVTYEEAKAALEASDWDILDALVLLESEGKVKKDPDAAEYTTREKPVEEKPQSDRSKFYEAGRKLGTIIGTLFQKGNANNFVITHHGKEKVSMPLTVLVVLLICCWPLSLIVLVLGLLLGLRYSFRGPDIAARVNDAMNKAADVVQGSDENKVE